MPPLQVVEAKKLAQAEELQRRRQAQNAREKMEWERRFVTQENEARKREHEERLKQLSVSYGLYMDKYNVAWMDEYGRLYYLCTCIHTHYISVVCTICT